MIPPSKLKSNTLQSYYQWQAPFYDATRWSFLFGRSRLIKRLPDLPRNAEVLEVGCGTGRNLKRLREHFPAATITGIDCSEAMLNIAASKHPDQRTKLIHKTYGQRKISDHKYDLILLSYSLTMMQQPVTAQIEQLAADLKENGLIAVVDFYHSPFNWFKRWMKKNHVAIDQRLLPLLKGRFYPIKVEVKRAYFGWWSYFSFIGKKTQHSD